MLRAIIFDFDGVITDTEILHLRTFNQVLARYGIEVTTGDYYKVYLGSTDSDCFKMLSDRHQLGLNAHEIENLIKQKNQAFEEPARSKLKSPARVRCRCKNSG